MDECKSHFLASMTQTQRQIKANNDKELLIGSQWLTLLVQSATLLRAQWPTWETSICLSQGLKGYKGRSNKWQWGDLEIKNSTHDHEEKLVMIIDNTQGWSAMTPLIVTKVDDGFF